MKPLWNLVGRAAAVLTATAGLTAAAAGMPAPGTVNYVQGQVTLDGQRVVARSGNPAIVEANRVLDTGEGMAEMLLTPGVFFRMGASSEVRMISPGLDDTRVELVRGTAMLEASEVPKQSNLAVMLAGAAIRIDKKGLYEFATAPAAAGVLDGEATVTLGNAHLNLKKEHWAPLDGGQPLKAQGLDVDAALSTTLFNWSEWRSQYEAQANIAAAQDIVANGGWFGDGWYWDPLWDCYTFLPGSGILYSPFGWGFYAPGWVSRVPRDFYRYRPVAGNRGVRAAAAKANVASGRGAAVGHAGGGVGHAGGGFGGGHGGGGGGRR